MATTFGGKTKVIATSDGSGGHNIVANVSTPRNAPSASGSRVEPKDSYKFVIGNTAVFKMTFFDTDSPIKADTGTKPVAEISQNGNIICNIEGILGVNQSHEYVFEWLVPTYIAPSGVYTVAYKIRYGGSIFVAGSEFFKLKTHATNIKIKPQAYATVDELRQDKFNIDAYLPPDLKQDKIARDSLLQQQLVTSSKWLNGQLNLRDFHSVYNDNFNLFTRYYTVWSILGQSLGESGSAISDKTLKFWETKWKEVLKQIKMHSQLSNIPVGRA